MKLINVSLMVALFIFIFNGVNGQSIKRSYQEFESKNGIYLLGKGVLGTYSSPPLEPNGGVDMHRLISELKDIHANTYDWLIWRGGEKDFEGLKKFLPLARKAGLNVWVTLVPPSEPPAPEPFGADYNKWAVALASLSKKYSNLKAWSIDDFTHNLKFFTPEYVKEFVSKSRKINPEFVFVPTCYYRGVDKSFVKGYSNWIGGILFPYRAASSDKMNLKDPSLVKSEVAHFHSLFGPDIPIIVDVYASAHSSLGNTTPEYVRTVVSSCLKYADGIMIYTNQDPQKNAKKYNIIKEEFRKDF